MVHDDADYDWGNRENNLYEKYTEVSIGVAYDLNNLYFTRLQLMDHCFINPNKETPEKTVCKNSKESINSSWAAS